MKRAFILAEGQTEETFVRQILQPFFEPSNLQLIPVILTTKRTSSGQKLKGGISTYSKVRRDLLSLLRDSNAAFVTSMIDLYGLPSDFPGHSDLPQQGTSRQKVEYLERSWSLDIENRRFLPYLSLHEFEALLLANPKELSAVLGMRAASRRRRSTTGRTHTRPRGS